VVVVVKVPNVYNPMKIQNYDCAVDERNYLIAKRFEWHVMAPPVPIQRARTTTKSRYLGFFVIFLQIIVEWVVLYDTCSFPFLVMGSHIVQVFVVVVVLLMRATSSARRGE
jgi:hypothetical protein